MALLDRALIASLVVSAALVSPSTAAACTCGSFAEPTAAVCATAKRVFAIRCSLERARTIFATVQPDDEDASRLAAAVARSPYACTDWGLARYEVESPCVGFPDGDGGQWWTCRDEHGFTTSLGWDLRR